MKAKLHVWVLSFALNVNYAFSAPAAEVNFIPRRITFEAPADRYQDWRNPLPCSSGHVTVFSPVEHANYESGAIIHLVSKDERNGIAARFETLDRVLPLRGQLQTFEDHRPEKVTTTSFEPSHPVVLEVTWTNARNFSFSFDGREHFTKITDYPIFWFQLQGVGSRVMFDNNELECDLIA